MSSYRELQKCAEREVAMRKNVFAKRGMDEKREREIRLMIEIAQHFRDLAEREQPMLTERDLRELDERERQEGPHADQPAVQS